MKPRRRAARVRVRRGILCAGNFARDYVAMIDHWPAEETIAEVQATSVGNGGPAYNIVVDLARLGATCPIEALGLVGDDADGRHILADCRRLGVDTRQLRRLAGASTSYSDILTVRASGRRTIIHHRGANARLDARHFDFAKTRARLLHLAFIALLDRLDAASASHGTVAAEVLARARAAGLLTSADVVSDASGRLPALVAPALPHLDYFFCNELEAELLTGVACRTPDGTVDPGRLEAAAAALIARGLRGWAVVHTAELAGAFRANEPAHWHGSVEMPRGSIVGTNGAGDAFAAGFLLAAHDGKPVGEALRVGVCAAASSLTDATPSAGVKRLPACLRLGAIHGFRPTPERTGKPAVGPGLAARAAAFPAGGA